MCVQAVVEIFYPWWFIVRRPALTLLLPTAAASTTPQPPSHAPSTHQTSLEHRLHSAADVRLSSAK